MKTLFYIGLLSILSCAAGADVLYSQPPSSSGGVIKSAWYPPDGLDGDQYVFDSFVLLANDAITEIQWLGGYTNFQSGAGESPVYDFTISIYASIAAGSQPDVVSPPLRQYTVGGNAGETLVGAFGGVPMYDYDFVLPEAFQAAAGTKYWVQIEASQGLTPFYYWPPDWGLCTGTGGDGSHFQAITGGTGGGGTLYEIAGGDTAFTLIGSSGPVATIAASVNPAGAGTITGDGAYRIGSTASLTATPNAGFGFVNWTENGAEVSTSATYNFTASTDRTLAANFATAYTITTNPLPGYAGSTGGDGVYNSGSTVTVTAAPIAGYAFVDWTEYGTEVSTSPSYSFPASANRDLVANFALVPGAVTFDFDTGFPPLSTGASTPFSQMSGGLTGQFSSPTAGALGFSIQTDAKLQYHMSRFYGNYLWPNSVYNPALDIQFSQPVNTINFTFATADFHQNETPTTIQAAGYDGSTALPPVASASGHGAYLGDTMPMGSLTLTSATPFDVVEIRIPYAPLAASDFLVDNITVVVAPVTISRVSDVRPLANGTKVRLTTAKAATVSSGAYSDGSIYLEEPDRSSGIKVYGASGVSEGNRITLTGSLGMDPNGEPVITVLSLDSQTPGPALRSLGMNNRSLGDLNQGLLVRVWGRVLTVASGNSSCTIDDGARANAGAGVPVLLDAVTKPVSVGDFVVVTGVATKAGVRPRADSDIQ